MAEVQSEVLRGERVTDLRAGRAESVSTCSRRGRARRRKDARERDAVLRSADKSLCRRAESRCAAGSSRRVSERGGREERSRTRDAHDAVAARLEARDLARAVPARAPALLVVRVVGELVGRAGEVARAARERDQVRGQCAGRGGEGESGREGGRTQGCRSRCRCGVRSGACRRTRGGGSGRPWGRSRGRRCGSTTGAIGLMRGAHCGGSKGQRYGLKTVQEPDALLERVPLGARVGPAEVERAEGGDALRLNGAPLALVARLAGALAPAAGRLVLVLGGAVELASRGGAGRRGRGVLGRGVDLLEEAAGDRVPRVAWQLQWRLHLVSTRLSRRAGRRER